MVEIQIQSCGIPLRPSTTRLQFILRKGKKGISHYTLYKYITLYNYAHMEYGLIIFLIIHPRHQVVRRKKDGTCDRHLRRTCFETPPNEVLRHEGRHLKFPLQATHQPLQR